MIADVKLDGLLGTFLYAFAAAGAGFIDLVNLLQLAGNGFKLTGTFADGAANAKVAVNLCNLTVIKIAPQRTVGTNFCAHHATSAFFPIDHRQVINDGKCTKLAGILAHFAPNTTDLAVIADQKAFFCRAAQKPNGQGFGLKAENMLGARLDACAAALTLFRIHPGNAGMLVNMDGIKFAGSYTGAQAQTGIFAGTITVVYQRGSHTILNAMIGKLGLASIQ